MNHCSVAGCTQNRYRHPEHGTIRYCFKHYRIHADTAASKILNDYWGGWLKVTAAKEMWRNPRAHAVASKSSWATRAPDRNKAFAPLTLVGTKTPERRELPPPLNQPGRARYRSHTPLWTGLPMRCICCATATHLPLNPSIRTIERAPMPGSWQDRDTMGRGRSCNGRMRAISFRKMADEEEENHRQSFNRGYNQPADPHRVTTPEGEKQRRLLLCYYGTEPTIRDIAYSGFTAKHANAAGRVELHECGLNTDFVFALNVPKTIAESYSVPGPRWLIPWKILNKFLSPHEIERDALAAPHGGWLPEDENSLRRYIEGVTNKLVLVGGLYVLKPGERLGDVQGFPWRHKPHRKPKVKREFSTIAARLKATAAGR